MNINIKANDDNQMLSDFPAKKVTTKQTKEDILLIDNIGCDQWTILQEKLVDYFSQIRDKYSKKELSTFVETYEDISIIKEAQQNINKKNIDILRLHDIANILRLISNGHYQNISKLMTLKTLANNSQELSEKYLKKMQKTAKKLYNIDIEKLYAARSETGRYFNCIQNYSLLNRDIPIENIVPYIKTIADILAVMANGQEVKGDLVIMYDISLMLQDLGVI